MKHPFKNKVIQMQSLLAFFERTYQSDLNLFGEDVNVIFWGVDLERKELYITEGSEKVYGYSSEEISETDLWYKVIHPEHENRKLELKRSLTGLKGFNIEYKIIKKDGTEAWVQTKGYPIYDTSNKPIRFNGFTLDITSRKSVEEDLAESASKYQTLVENSAQAVYISQNGLFQYTNQQMTRLTGYSQEELSGMKYDQILDEESKRRVLKRVSLYLSGKETKPEEIKIIKKNKAARVVELRSSLITYKGESALMGTLLDVTEKKEALEMIKSLAYFDTLTGLPNRNQFYEKMQTLLTEANNHQTQLAVMFIDLNNLKAVNDTYGHSEGDKLIRKAAIKINEVISSKGFTARYGGDKFVAVVGFEVESEVGRLVESLLKEVPSVLSSTIPVAITIGVSYYPEHGKSIETLLRFADIAMYFSKDNLNGEGKHSIYNPSISQDILKITKLTSDLPKAFQDNQFYLMYQPKVELSSSTIYGVEALIRWQHPDFGFVSPGEFIPIAEKSGQINRIGTYVLETAIKELNALKFPSILSVNISPRQLLQSDFVEQIESVLERQNFPPHRLNLEITESVEVFGMEKTLTILTHLNELGVLISLDDFGTGYSSLSYLTQLPIHYLKIDQSFVRNMEKDNSKKIIVKSIIDIAHNLGIKVIAEGIETSDQAILLNDADCDIGQGYFFSRPLLSKDLNNYVKKSVY
ncbi:EAL and GGDEF domain-containing protein [Planococcus dechangensis]|uniref:EAL domain-containing protein n=1 Tax=Planococcus dechangensis TaxID=1176255 RepID=A0ABV9M9L3_9BACL